MKKFMAIILVAAAMAAAWPSLQAADRQPAVKIYLPQSLSVQTPSLELGAISIIRCDDDKLARASAGVTLGRSPWPNEQMVIDRQTILSRLASVGIDGSQVEMTGADKIVLQREIRLFKAQELIRAAEAFLQEQRPGPEGCLWQVGRKLDDMAVPMAPNIRLQVRPVKDAAKDRVRLEVVAVSGKDDLAKTEAIFQVLYPQPQAVAVKDIPAGGMLTRENVKIQTITSPTRSDTPFSEPYGMVAARPIKQGTVLAAGQYLPPRPEVLVKRNQSVAMRIQCNGFEVTGVGEALEDGRGGEFIKVRNVDSKRTITARVAFDGSVEPIMGETKK